MDNREHLRRCPGRRLRPLVPAGKTRSIHDINSRRREVFYWVAVFFTFALSTALGDLTAANWHRGFLGSIVLIAALVTYLSVTHHRRRPHTI